MSRSRSSILMKKPRGPGSGTFFDSLDLLSFESTEFGNYTESEEKTEGNLIRMLLQGRNSKKNPKARYNKHARPVMFSNQTVRVNYTLALRNDKKREKRINDFKIDNFLSYFWLHSF